MNENMIVLIVVIAAAALVVGLMLILHFVNPDNETELENPESVVAPEGSGMLDVVVAGMPLAVVALMPTYKG